MSRPYSQALALTTNWAILDGFFEIVPRLFLISKGNKLSIGAGSIFRIL